MNYAGAKAGAEFEISNASLTSQNNFTIPKVAYNSFACSYNTISSPCFIVVWNNNTDVFFKSFSINGTLLYDNEIKVNQDPSS